MAYHVELKGVPLSSKQSDTAAYVLQGSVSIETAIAERPTAALSVRVPAGVTLAPKDFDEVTIDYPALPYRAWAERHANLDRLLAAGRSGVSAGGGFQGRDAAHLRGRSRPPVSGLPAGDLSRAVRRGSRVGAHVRGRPERDAAELASTPPSRLPGLSASMGRPVTGRATSGMGGRTRGPCAPPCSWQTSRSHSGSTDRPSMRQDSALAPGTT